VPGSSFEGTRHEEKMTLRTLDRADVNVVRGTGGVRLPVWS